tara:strand:- start:206 stop:619 length:414 start_codon:yes stop_codon:yes gene_type:complete
MIEDDFYATLKFKNGEEIFAKVAPSEEEDRTMLLISHPVTICEIKVKGGIAGYKVEPWLKTSSEDLLVINMNDLLTISESSDLEMIMMYQTFVADSVKNKNNQESMSRKMGFLGKVDDTKNLLEKIYKNNNYQPPQR